MSCEEEKKNISKEVQKLTFEMARINPTTSPERNTYSYRIIISLYINAVMKRMHFYRLFTHYKLKCTFPFLPRYYQTVNKVNLIEMIFYILTSFQIDYTI